MWPNICLKLNFQKANRSPVPILQQPLHYGYQHHWPISDHDAKSHNITLSNYHILTFTLFHTFTLCPIAVGSSEDQRPHRATFVLSKKDVIVVTKIIKMFMKTNHNHAAPVKEGDEKLKYALTLLTAKTRSLISSRSSSESQMHSTKMWFFRRHRSKWEQNMFTTRFK